MFGRSTIGGATRRSRLRLGALVVGALLVALLVGEVIDQIVESSTPNARREAASWTAGLGPIVLQSRSTGAELARLLSSASTTDLAGVHAMVETLTSTSRSEQQSFDQLGMAPPRGEAAELATTMFSDRSRAMAALASSVQVATGGSGDTVTAGGDCAQAAALISSSDSAARRLDDVLRSTKGATAPARAEWSSDGPTLVAADCDRFLSSLTANHRLAPSASLRILAISVQPNPVRIEGVPNPTTTTTTVAGPTGASGTSGASGASGTSGATYVLGPSGVLAPARSTTTTTTLAPVTTTTLQIPPDGARSYLPPTSSITVEVVVANRGDVAVGPVLVHTQLLGGAGLPSPSKDMTVASIPAGGSSYLSVGPLSVKRLRTDFTLYVSASSTGLATAVERVALAKS